MADERPVGRPRQFDHDIEQLILDAAYGALRDGGPTTRSPPSSPR
jgi:hypothetical protein